MGSYHKSGRCFYRLIVFAFIQKEAYWLPFLLFFIGLAKTQIKLLFFLVSEQVVVSYD